jgi:hypothetical protein
MIFLFASSLCLAVHRRASLSVLAVGTVSMAMNLRAVARAGSEHPVWHAYVRRPRHRVLFKC